MIATKDIDEDKIAIEHDLYDLSIFKEVANDSDSLHEIITKGEGDLKNFTELSADLFFSLFKYQVDFKDDAAGIENPITMMNKQLIKQIMQTSEYNELRAFTKLDEIQASMGTASLGKQVLKENAEKIEEMNELIKQMEDSQEDINDINKEIDKIKEAYQYPDLTINEKRELANQYNIMKDKLSKIQYTQEKIKDLMKFRSSNITTRSAIRSCMKNALDLIKLQDNFFGFGMGMEKGQYKPTDYKDRLKLANQVIKNDNLLKIAELAGKFKKLAIRKQKQKTKHSFSEISTIIEGNDISRIIPSELLNLIDPDLEILFYKRFAEDQLLIYDLKGEETKTKGSIITCIDVSGSMAGFPDTWCKAIALALIQIAHKEKRNSIVIPFDSILGKIFEFFKNDYSISRMLEMASYFTGGGTNFNNPISKALEFLEKEKKLKKADIIFITDGNGYLDQKLKSRFQDLQKEMDFSLFTIVIGESFQYVNHALQDISTKLIPVKELTDKLAEDIFETV